MYKAGIIVILFLSISLPHAFAQHKLRGIVAEKESGIPIPFATVQAKNAKHTLTNDNGEFEIDVAELPASVTISHLNYISVIAEIKNAGQEIKLLLEPQVLTLKEVKIGNPAIAIMQEASDKARKTSEKPHFGKAFLRQIAYESDRPSYLNEIFFNAEWKPYGLIAWHPTEARHLKGAMLMSYSNLSYFSFIFSGFMGNNLHFKPLFKKVDSLYHFRLAGTYEQNGQEIAKIICTPKSKRDGKFFEGVYYVNTVTDDVVKIDGTIKGLKITGEGPFSLQIRDVVFTAQYKISKEGDNVLDYAVLNLENKLRVFGVGAKRTDLYSTLYMVDDDPFDRTSLVGVRPDINDADMVKATTYNAAFWKNNQGIKRTEKEQSAIEILEKIPQVKK